VALRPHRVDRYRLRGHAGHPENERADVLAKEAMEVIEGLR
jgi:ribonuclease HI